MNTTVLELYVLVYVLPLYTIADGLCSDYSCTCFLSVHPLYLPIKRDTTRVRNLRYIYLLSIVNILLLFPLKIYPTHDIT